MLLVDKVDLMFFKKASAKKSTPKTSTVRVVKEKIESSRTELKQKLAQIDAVNLSVCEASLQTQAVAIETAEKMKCSMKIPKKSLRAISAKLHEGLVLINSAGEITHINRAGLKILGLNEDDVVGKKMGDLVKCSNPVVKNGVLIEKPILRTEFFPELSEKIFAKLTAPTMEIRGKYIVCNDMLKEELPFCFEAEVDKVMGVSVYCRERKISNMSVTFTVIDNEPDEITDITYLFLFSTNA